MVQTLTQPVNYNNTQTRKGHKAPRHTTQNNQEPKPQWPISPRFLGA
jgi:hypothetical protein